MLWKEFKDLVEKAGITDDMNIMWIDTSFDFDIIVNMKDIGFITIS